MHKNAQKLSEKVRAKFSATTRGYSMVKFACLDDVFLEVFLTESKPSRRSMTTAKRKKGGKGKVKKIKKSKSLKTCNCRSLLA